jgi:hypothetical protein
MCYLKKSVHGNEGMKRSIGAKKIGEKEIDGRNRAASSNDGWNSARFARVN